MCLFTLKDGKELPKVIGFEGEDEETASTSLLPQVHMKMENCQPEAEKIILQFLQEYFKVTSNFKIDKMNFKVYDISMLRVAVHFFM